MKIFDKDGADIINGTMDQTPEGLLDIVKLANIVFNKHFFYFGKNPFDREDMIQESVVGALLLLKQGTFDPSRSSLKNYLYTKMRNEMQNFVYRNKKEVLLDELQETNLSEPEEVSSLHEFSVNDVMKILQEATFSPYTELDSVCSSIIDLGFLMPDFQSYTEIRTLRSNRLAVIIIWEFLRSREDMHG